MAKTPYNLPLTFATLTSVGMFTFLLYFTFGFFGVESTIEDRVLLARTRSRVVFVVYGRRTNQISDYTYGYHDTSVEGVLRDTKDKE